MFFKATVNGLEDRLLIKGDVLYAVRADAVREGHGLGRGEAGARREEVTAAAAPEVYRR